MNRLPNAAAVALGGQPDVRGGWLDGLTRLAAQLPGVTLTVAAESALAFESAEVDGVRYVNASTGHRGRFGKAYRRWFEDPCPRKSVERCRQIIHEADPDLVHVHGSEFYFGLAASTCDRPWLVSLQGIPSVYSAMQWRGVDSSYLSSARLRELAIGGGALLDERMMQRRGVAERSWMPACKHVIGRTRWDSYVSSILAPAATYHHCDEVMRDAFVGPRWNPHDKTDGVLFAVAGSYPLKGTGQLLDAFATASARDDSLRLRIAGMGPGSLGERASQAKIRALRLRDRVELLGPLSADEIAAELIGCTAFVHPSHIDNSPNSICEAMIVGAPVVATAVGGVMSLLADGAEGLLVQDGDPTALAGAILRLVRDSDYASALGHEARKRALRRHNTDAIAHDLRAAYRVTIGDPHAAND